MRFISTVALAVCGLTMSANAEVVIPGCRKLEAFPYQRAITDQDWIAFFGQPLVNLMPDDFNRIRAAMLQCAGAARGWRFASFHKDYFHMYLDQALAPARAKAEELRTDAAAKAATQNLFARLDTFHSLLQAKSDPRPVLSAEQLAELDEIEQSANVADRTRDKQYLARIQSRAHEIRSANSWANTTNQQAIATAQREVRQKAEGGQAELIAAYTNYLVAEACTREGFGFNESDLARIKAEVGKISNASSLPQEKKNEFWGVLANVVAAQAARVDEYICGDHRQSLLFSMPQVFDSQAPTNPFSGEPATPAP